MILFSIVERTTVCHDQTLSPLLLATQKTADSRPGFQKVDALPQVGNLPNQSEVALEGLRWTRGRSPYVGRPLKVVVQPNVHPLTEEYPPKQVAGHTNFKVVADPNVHPLDGRRVQGLRLKDTSQSKIRQWLIISWMFLYACLVTRW